MQDLVHQVKLMNHRVFPAAKRADVCCVITCHNAHYVNHQGLHRRKMDQENVQHARHIAQVVGSQVSVISVMQDTLVRVTHVQLAEPKTVSYVKMVIARIVN